MLFQEFVTTLEISVKMIFPEPGKFQNIQKLSSTLKTYAKPIGIIISEKEIQRKSDMNERNITNYSKKNQHFIQKVLCDIGNLKYVQPRRFCIAHL